MKCNVLYKCLSLFLSTCLFVSSSSAVQITWHRLDGEKNVAARRDVDYPVCGAPLLQDESNFTIQEVYESDQVQIQIGPDVRIGLSCGVSVNSKGVNSYLTGLQDYGAGIYGAEGEGSTFTTMFHVGGFCIQQDSSAAFRDLGYLNTTPHLDAAAHKVRDYVVYDGKILGEVNAKENLADQLTIRDADQNLVANAGREGTQWKVNNPQKLSSVHIAFLLTHKLNKNASCWGITNSDGQGGQTIGFWPAVGIAAGVTAAIAATTGIVVSVTCTLLSNRPAIQPPPLPTDPEMHDLL